MNSLSRQRSTRRWRLCLFNTITVGCTTLCQLSTAENLLPDSVYFDQTFTRTGLHDYPVWSSETQLIDAVEHGEMIFDDSPLVNLPGGECKTCEVCGNAKEACPGVSRDPGYPAKPKHQRPGDINHGDAPGKRYRMDDCERSGDPYCVYRWATPSITPKYSAWYTGGGAAFHGRGRTSQEGTWGLDYNGLFGHARTWMNYTCGKYQGGEGAYEGEHVPLQKKFSAGH
jgi:hypothetical protein